jgi:formiminotetrahydrofolate cyclodeaminase
VATNTIWNATLESFRESVASAEPPPAGVAVAAVSATLGVNLLLKVLAIVARRKSFAADTEKLSPLLQAAKNESVRLTQYADDDIAAYRAYLESRRLKIEDHAMALREAIETPFRAAESALSSLDLCADAAGLVHGAVLADLATAAILLNGAIRAMLLSVEVNLQQLSDAEISAKIQLMREKARQELDVVLGHISTAEQAARNDAI